MGKFSTRNALQFFPVRHLDNQARSGFVNRAKELSTGTTTHLSSQTTAASVHPVYVLAMEVLVRATPWAALGESRDPARYKV